MAEDIDRLSAAELLVFAGLVRKLVRVDGHFTDPERDAIARVSMQIGRLEEAPGSAGYRSAELSRGIGEDAIHALIAQAADAYPDDPSIRAAALTVTRPDARAAMHAHLFDVAASDMISKGESDLLDWLEEKWELEITGELEGENTTVG